MQGEGGGVVAIDDEPGGGGEPGRMRQVVGAQLGQGVTFELVGVFRADRKVDLVTGVRRQRRTQLSRELAEVLVGQDRDRW